VNGILASPNPNVQLAVSKGMLTE